MVEFKEISESELKHFIECGYRDDKDLFSTYNIIQGSFDVCVNEQLKIIRTQAKFDDLSYYSLHNEKEPIGYTVVGKNYLFSFAINIFHRSKETVLEWWDKVKEMFNNHFGLFLYKKNERAIKFFLRNGMVVSNDCGDYLTLIYQ
jgi:hypothetical protein